MTVGQLVKHLETFDKEHLVRLIIVREQDELVFDTHIEQLNFDYPYCVIHGKNC